MLLITHDPSSLSFFPFEKHIAVMGGHIFMPVRVAASSLRRHRQVPFCKSSHLRLAPSIGGFGVHNLYVALERLVEHIVAVRLGPPFADS